jgi:hypothetical protein
MIAARVVAVGFVQKTLKAVMPHKLAEAMEAESRLWMMRCPDGHEISVWDAGGIRYKAKGKAVPRLFKCAECGKLRKMELFKAEAPREPNGAEK